MFFKNFIYYAPSTLMRALELLKKGSRDTKIMAGAQSLVSALQTRSPTIKKVVDISGIKELYFIRREDNTVRIGALTTIDSLGANNEIQEALPALKLVAQQICLQSTLSTVGGNLCHADLANPLVAFAIEKNAIFTLASKKQIRRLNAEAFFLAPFKKALWPNEVLTEVQIAVDLS